LPQTIVIPLGTTGLVKADLGLRYYSNGVLDAGAVVAALTVTEVGGGDYRVSGLPDVTDATLRTLTWEYPAGVGGYYVYPMLPSTVPVNLILAVREAGLSAGDLSLALYKDGVLRGDALTVVEVGPTGEYRVSGWPLTTAGAWSLVWRRHGLSFSYSWTVSPNTGTGFTRFLSILAEQEPFPIGLDAKGRNMFSVNFTAVAATPIASWVACVIKVLNSAGLGTFGTDIFAGPAVALPVGAGPYISVIDTGGTAPIWTRDAVKYKRLSVQLVVTATNYELGMARALAAYDALDGIRNTTVAA
jgi:hypothetical protein